MGWLKCLPFLSGRVMIDLSFNIGINFTFGLLDCDRYIWDIVIPWIVKPGFCSIPYTVTLAGLKGQEVKYCSKGIWLLYSNHMGGG